MFRTNSKTAALTLLFAMGLSAVVACQTGNSGSQTATAKPRDYFGKNVDPNCQIDGDSNGPGSESIINGTTLKPGSRLARGMAFLVTQKNSDGDGELCSATLIAPDLVLTAAHCVTDGHSQVLPPENVSVTFSVDPICSQVGHHETNDILGASKIVMNPDYRDDVIGTNDLALIFLKFAAPSWTSPIALSFEKQTLTPKDLVYIAGYGRQNDESQGDVQDDAKLRFAKLSPVDPGEQMDAYNNQFEGPQLLTLHNDQGQAGCSGDSGGPALIVKDGVLTQVGIASFVFADKGSDAKCLGRISYTRTSFYAQWILDNSGGRLR